VAGYGHFLLAKGSHAEAITAISTHTSPLSTDAVYAYGCTIFLMASAHNSGAISARAFAAHAAPGLVPIIRS
jgi:hypothetical protein